MIEPTEAQLELLRDKYVLWDRAAREGHPDLRDYNRRAADALKAVLAVAQACTPYSAEPDEAALERAARAIHSANANAEHPWFHVDPDYCAKSRELARAALAALTVKGS